MSISENPPDDAPQKSIESSGESAKFALVQAEVRSLRILLNVALASLMVLVVSLFCFMFQERRLVRQKIEDNSRYIADYKRKVEPRLAELHTKLFAYSKQHTNFTPIFLKYFGATNRPAGAGATSSIPSTLSPDPGEQPPP